MLNAQVIWLVYVKNVETHVQVPAEPELDVAFSITFQFAHVQKAILVIHSRIVYQSLLHVRALQIYFDTILL